MHPPFEYDRFQKEAMNYIDQGHSVVVSAPTGSGKTVIAEYVIDVCVRLNKGAIYTAPIKALSNQKYRDFCERYGVDQVGIVTGDVSINPDAPVVIMTTEIFRNALFDEEERFQDKAWVIFDEIHFIDDFERGTVWEESLMFFPEHLKILALSATVPNLNDFVDWLRQIHTFPISIVLEESRPVPLTHYFQCGNLITNSLGRLSKKYTQMLRQDNEGSWGGNRFGKHKFGPMEKKQDRWRPMPKDSLRELLDYIREQNDWPCIYFAFARKRCEELAVEVSQMKLNLLNREETDQLLTLYQQLLSKYHIQTERSALKLMPLVANGIAYHHAGMLPSLKEVVERLFASRLIKLIFTTETFALGVNMPAKAVVFDELRKFYGVQFEAMHTRDYYQMAGRAGRRGLDEHGSVYARVNPFRIKFLELKRMVKGPPEEVLSQFNTSYATLMHLYAQFGQGLYDIYPKSLHYYQANKRGRKQAVSVIRSKIDMLKKMGYLKEEGLTSKGLFACQMYGYELVLGELFESGILEELDEVSLCIVLGAIVYEPRKRELCPPLSNAVKMLKKRCSKACREIVHEERGRGIEPWTKKSYFHMAPIIQQWCGGADFADLVAYGDAAEGEIVRYMRMVIQLLRLLLHSPYVSPQFKSKARRALDLINRGAVDAERQLRTE